MNRSRPGYTIAIGATPLAVLGAILLVLLFQGVRSAYRFTPSKLGYPVIAIDATPRWAATRALFLQGINPYSAEGDAVIHTAYFGRPLEARDADTIKDKQLFAYPLYVVWLYAPTVLLDFSAALVLLWFAGFLALGGSVLIWFRLLHFPAQAGARAVFAILILCLPATYTALQTRQPALWVLFFCSAAVLWLGRGRAATDAAAGVALALATIKPQSSILVAGYLLLSFGLMERGRRRWVLPLSFAASMVILWGASEWLVPGWVGDFLAGAQGYREYAGSTGAEGALGAGSPAVPIAGLVFAGIWVGMVADAARRRTFAEGHLWAVAYAMLLQAWLLPTHSYNLLFGVPLVLLTAREIWRGRGTRTDWQTLVLGTCFAAALYLLYSQWTGILSEGGVGAAGVIRAVLPGGAFWFPPCMMALGGVTWWSGVHRRAGVVKEAAA